MLPFIVGVAMASVFGYTDVVTLTTFGACAVTYIVGPVMGTAIGVSSDVIELEYRHGRHQGDHRDDRDAGGGEIHAPQNAAFGNGVRRVGRNGEAAPMPDLPRQIASSSPTVLSVSTFHTGIGRLLRAIGFFSHSQSHRRTLNGKLQRQSSSAEALQPGDLRNAGKSRNAEELSGSSQVPQTSQPAPIDSPGPMRPCR